jgi:chromosome partitioning protein
MKIFACYSSKGGVGKTSTAVNLAYASAASGKRTLLIDLDQQGAATFYFRVRPPKPSQTKKLKTILGKSAESPEASIRESDFENLHLLPATQSYRNFDAQLDGMKGSKRKLADFIQDVGSGYQRVFLDCPPTLSRLAENVFRVADLILVPVIPTTLSERTFLQLKEFIDASDFKKRKLRPFMSMVESRKRIQLDTMARPRATEKRILNTSIPYSAEVEAMGVRRSPVLAFSPHHPASESFRRLYDEVEEIAL